MGTVSDLRPREYECLYRLAEGASYSEAARDMGIAYSTFKNHLTSGYRRLGVNTLAQAMIVVGWVTLPEAGAPLVGNVGPRP